MSKVKYRDIPTSLDQLSRPTEGKNRVSLGLENNIGEFYNIDVNDLLPFKNQARQYFAEDEIAALADSIKKHGIRQPLTVISCTQEKGKYEVVSGERRLRAAKVVGLEKVPCILLKNDKVAEEIAIVENVHREDLHPIELGEALSSLLKEKIFASQVELSKNLSMSESTISEYLQYTNIDVKFRRYIVEHNIKSRDILRQIVNAGGDEAIIEKILGLTVSKVLKRNFSVLRAVCVNDFLQFQTGGIKKLNAEQRRELKNALEKIMRDI